MPAKPFWILPLFVVVVLRSYVGMNQQFSWKGDWYWGWILFFALVFGKMIGGVLIDHIDSQKTVLYTLLLSGIFYLFSSSLPLAGVLAVFLFNMTMPITLWYMGRLLLRAKGFALLVGFRRGHALKYVAIANILTNPAVVLIHYLVYYILPEYVLLITLLLEIMAVIVEWCYYRHYLKESKHPF